MPGFSLSSLIPQPTTPLGNSLMRALMGKHGLTMGDGPPAGGAPPVGPKDGPLGSAAIGDKVASAVDSLPLADVNMTAPPNPALDTPDLQLGAKLIGSADDALAGMKVGHGGMLGRINDFLQSDDGRAALFRAGAAMLSGKNVGEGAMAGADFIDKRKKERADATQQEFENQFKTREHDDNFNLGVGRLKQDQARLEEDAAHNRAGEAIQGFGIRSENWRHSSASGDAQLNATTQMNNNAVTQAHEDYRAGLAQRGENFRHSTVSADTAATQAGENSRADLQYGGGKPDTREFEYTMPGSNGGPDVKVKTTRNLGFGNRGPRPSDVRPNAGPVHITGDADYAALPSGTRFVGPDGIPRTKP